MTRFVAVFGSSSCRPGDEEYEEAIAWGAAIGTAGYGVVTGGYMGAMEAAAKGARDAGAEVIGVTVPTLFADRGGANEWVSIELPAPDLIERISRLLDLSVASVSLRGSIGTLAELMCAWNLAFVHARRHHPYKPVGVHHSWMPLLTAKHIMRPEQTKLLTPLDTVEHLERFLSHIPAPTTVADGDSTGAESGSA